MFRIFTRKVPKNLARLVLNDIFKKNYSLSNFPRVPLLEPINVHYNQQFLRYKSKNKQPTQSQSETESEEQSTFEDKLVDRHTKILQINVQSLRIDGLLKSGLGIARNKIEKLFYESKIRVNGQKLMKKSDPAQEGDEIDIIKSVSPTNPDFLIVARLEILGIKESGDHLTVKVRRCKSLTVENYDQ